MTNRKHYTREFKLEAVRLLETTDKPITAIARQLGVRRNLLYKWRDTLTEKGAGKPIIGRANQGSASPNHASVWGTEDVHSPQRTWIPLWQTPGGPSTSPLWH